MDPKCEVTLLMHSRSQFARNKFPLDIQNIEPVYNLTMAIGKMCNSILN